MKLPLISCVCVTQNRKAFLKSAVAYFLNQTYPHKELVVVYGGDDNLGNLISENASSKIRIINIKSNAVSLGERRNISIENCTGEYFCQWDDDDWYHNRRLEMQMNSLITSGKEACVLERWLLYDSMRDHVYLSSKRVWEGSLLCKTEIFNDVLKYPSIGKGEDNAFVIKLINHDYIHSLNAPHLYTYVYHGSNTWNADHFQQLFNAGEKLPEGSGLLMRKILDGKYTYKKASELIEKFLI